VKRACRMLFICTGNAGRSQIAAVLCERLGGESVIVRSAGVEHWEHLHPMAVRLMTERGYDVSGLYPKPVSAVLDKTIDIVVTIGDPAKEKLPRPMPGDPMVLHWDISDPADADGTSESESVFRRTWEMIEARMPDLMATVKQQTQQPRALVRPGISTGIWYPDRFEPAVHLPQAVAAGFVAIELNCFLGVKHFDYRSPDAVRELKQVANDLGVEISSIHEPQDARTLGAVDPAARQNAVDELKLTLDLAVQLGASAIPSHALLHHFRAGSDVAQWEIAADTLAELEPTIRASGAMIAIENGTSDTRGVLDLFASLPAGAFGFVIDTGHANIAGGDDDIRLVIDTVGDRMISLHLNDNNGKQDSHHPPGEGTVDWPSIADGLRTSGYHGCIMWEVFARLGERQDDPAAVMDRTIATSYKLFNAEFSVQ